MSLRLSQWQRHIAAIVIAGATVMTVTDGGGIATNVVSGNGGAVGITAIGTGTGGRSGALIPAYGARFGSCDRFRDGMWASECIATTRVKGVL